MQSEELSLTGFRVEFSEHAFTPQKETYPFRDLYKEPDKGRLSKFPVAFTFQVTFEVTRRCPLSVSLAPVPTSSFLQALSNSIHASAPSCPSLCLRSNKQLLLKTCASRPQASHPKRFTSGEVGHMLRMSFRLVWFASLVCGCFSTDMNQGLPGGREQTFSVLPDS